MISCKEYVDIKKKELKEKISKLENKPRLCVIQVGDNPASTSYINGKKKDCAEVGIECEHIKLPEDITQRTLEAHIKLQAALLCNSGIIVQLPLPKHIDAERIEKLIPKEKDVDGFRVDSSFNPCTPQGIIDWLKYNNYDFVGKYIVVLGRSKIVGKPLVNMLIDEGATVTCCNSHTTFAWEMTKDADVVISAIGKPKYINRKYFTNQTVVVDVGINRDENGKLCGDVDVDKLSELDNVYVTPVPGGVGLLTRYTLLENTYKATLNN